MASVQKITPNLWFDNNAEDAVNFYISIFKDAKALRVARYGKEGFEIHKMPEGSVMTIEFQLAGNRFVALNGGPIFKFSEAISFIVDCEDQEEIDYYWNKLSEGGDPNSQVCGWLKDKFGLSWQVVPRQLVQMVTDEDEQKAQKAMKAMLGMKKIILKDLRNAFDGVSI